MDWRDSADRIEPALANEPTEQMQANDATEPIDRIEPAEPMLRIEPDEPIDRIDPLDPMLRIEPAEPPGRCDLPLIPMPGFSHPSTGTAAQGLGRQCPSRGFRSSSQWTSRKGGSGERPPDGEAMIYTLSYQQYKYERGLTAAEQRAADVRAGETAAAARDLRAWLGRRFRLRHRVRLGPGPRGAADTMTAPVRFLSSAR
jgi:hypothetical protein